MLEFLNRRKQLQEEKQRHSDEQDARIERGFREIDTAVELVQQMARGELPPNDIVEIGDGFYVEQHPDGSRKVVMLDKSKIPAARIDTTAPKRPKP